MADPEKERASLELPKLRLRRKRTAPTAPEPDPNEAGPVEPSAAETAVLDLEPIDEPAGPTSPAVAPRRRARLAWRPAGMVAAVVTGLVVGLGTVGLTWAGLRSCEGVLGTSSCGGVGYPVLGLILVVMVLVGAVLLRLAGVIDPGTTSFLGLGLAVVVALLVLVDHLMDPSMVVVVPVICAATYALAHWVTRTFIEPARD